MTKLFVGEKNLGSEIHLCPGKNLYNGSAPFSNLFGVLNSLEEDLLNLASGIYASDLSVLREQREEYIRNLEVNIEVVNLDAFERIGKDLEYALSVLSRDNWRINFIQKSGSPVTDFKWEKKEGTVLLFSGGLDSMCAAADFLNQNKEIVLVSHNTQGNREVDESQKKIHKTLEKFYKKEIPHAHIKVYGRKSGSFDFPEERENTQRSRSFLFLSIAALVTRRYNYNNIIFMAENGQFAIHLPLNQSRIGPFSTHTADPEFVILIQEIFKILLRNTNLNISNPYLYKTKAEVVSILPQKLHDSIKLSTSCWKIQRLKKHCGFCIPCITRRIALEWNGIPIDDYKVDIFKTDFDKLSEDSYTKRNFIDYLEFVTHFKTVTDKNKKELLNVFPELYNTAFDTDKALELYIRVAKNSFDIFTKYPLVKKLLK